MMNGQKLLTYSALIAAFIMFSAQAFAGPRNKVDKNRDALTELPFTLTISSSTLPNSLVIPEENVFSGFGCSGGNVSPALAWTAGPEGTKSYLVMMYDPDAPTGVGFHHWTVANIEPSILNLKEGVGAKSGAVPMGGLQGRNDYGISHYGGPCPPQGRTHRYEFYVWALGVESLPIDGQTSPAVVRFMVGQNALAVGRMVATYGR